MVVFESLLAGCQEALEQGDLERATALARRASRCQPERFEPLLRMVDVRIGQGRLGEARALAEELRAEHPTRLEPHLALAQVFIARGDRWRARALLNQTVEQFPSESAPLVALAQLAAAEGQHREALKRIQQVLRVSPRTASLLHFASREALAGGDSAQALALAMEAFPLAPDQLESHLVLVRAHAAEGQLAIAAMLIHKAVARLGEHAALTLERARVARMRGRRVEANEAYDAYTRARPDDATAWLERARLEMELRDFERALVSVKRSIGLDASAKAYTLKGRILSELGDHVRAERAFRSAIERSPGDFEPHMQLGLLVSRAIDRADEATELLDLARCLVSRREVSKVKAAIKSVASRQQVSSEHDLLRSPVSRAS